MAKKSVAISTERSVPNIPRSAAERLLESVVAIGGGPSNLAEGRRAFLSVLTDVLDADAGHWSWGRGTHDAKSVIPVAMIDVGLSHIQRSHLVAWTHHSDADHSFRARVQARQAEGNRSVTSRRNDLFPNAEWRTQHPLRMCLERAGLDGWLHSIRYSAADSWSTFAFFRKIGRDPFHDWHVELLDLAMTSVTWMHSTADEVLPSESLVGLQPRQRMVMQMLLDGLTRKSIAGRLGITPGTVGDHIKAIYKHFGVGSATELAALFLRGK